MRLFAFGIEALTIPESQVAVYLHPVANLGRDPFGWNAPSVLVCGWREGFDSLVGLDRFPKCNLLFLWWSHPVPTRPLLVALIQLRLPLLLAVTLDRDLTRDGETVRSVLLPLFETVCRDVNLVPFLRHRQ